MTTYAEALKAQLAHTPVAPTVSKEGRAVFARKLIAATANVGEFVAINPTHAAPGEKLGVVLDSC